MDAADEAIEVAELIYNGAAEDERASWWATWCDIDMLPMTSTVPPWPASDYGMGV